MLKQLVITVPDLRGLLLVVLAASWLAGIICNSWLLLTAVALLIPAVCSLFLICLYWHKPFIRTAGLVLLCLCLGAWRYTLASPINDPHAIGIFIGHSKLQIQGEIANEPRLESNSTLLTVATQSISLDGGQHWQAVQGQVQVQILGATFDDPYAARYGDTVRFSGTLATPPGYSTPDIQASVSFPRLYITNRGNSLLALFYQMRATLANILMRALPQPMAALLIAIFLSLRTPALKPLIPLFNVSGTAHLIAPSGFKVTLLVGLISGGTRWLMPKQSQQNQLLPAERRRDDWKCWLHTLLIVLCIAAYTILSGGGPAATRAGVMGTLLVLAPRLERSYNVYTALAITALLMSAVDPLLLWDSGFQLSFIGTLGIVLFTPFFQRVLHFLARLPAGQHVAEIVAVTLAAQVATLPIFALSFNQISFIAPLANIISVPLLGALLGLGGLICLSGLLSLQLALVCGWLAWPLLWYVTTMISWCAHLPGAYVQVDNLQATVAWFYYALLAWLCLLILLRWRLAASTEHQQVASPFSHRTKRILQCGLALSTILATCVMIQAAQPDGYLTIALLTTGDPARGEALFLRTPNGQTALIDEGADSATIAQTLDTRLPFWQRSLDLVILSDTSPDNVAGLQDVVTRYQVGRVIDAGMLHPSLAYARWRGTIDAHNLSYTRVRQGSQIALGNQVSFQVLWPPAHLHKSSDETHDNALILRLLAPGLSMLMLNSSTLSNYTLQALTSGLASPYLQAEIVQITSEQGKTFPAALSAALTQIRPSLLFVTSLPARKNKRAVSPDTIASTPVLPVGPWEILHSEQSGPVELRSDRRGWNISPSG